MFGIRFMKASPTNHVIHYKNGAAVREGAGLAFLYYEPTSTIASVPLASNDVPFVFTETTADFQTVTVQGQLTYRVADPQRLAALLDFTVDGHGAFRGEGPAKLGQRLINEAQILTNDFIHRGTLKEALRSAEPLAQAVLQGFRSSPAMAMLGVEILGFSVLAIRPTPEMARALEAEAREALQKDADQALYDRRNYAVEQERTIKESELNTEIAVEGKRRRIRETQTDAEIAVEEKRRTLVEMRAENERKEADSKAYALQEVLRPLAGVDWRVLLAVGKAGQDPKAMIALAFREIAENAQRIGSLNISPELLATLMDETKRK